MNRNEMVRHERLYALGCLLAVILFVGSVGSVELESISFWNGAWQILCSVILGLWCWNGIRLEEERMYR